MEAAFALMLIGSLRLSQIYHSVKRANKDTVSLRVQIVGMLNFSEIETVDSTTETESKMIRFRSMSDTKRRKSALKVEGLRFNT